MIHDPHPCSVCPNACDGDRSDHTDRIVLSDGPDSADTLFVVEGPGYWEDRRKRCFVGKTGREFNETYLPRKMHLRRPDVKMANAVSCFFGGDNQTKDQALHCAPVNLAPLVRKMPHLRYVVLMGAVAASLAEHFAVDADTGSSLDPIDISLAHGLPCNDGRDVLLFGRRVKLFVVLHPAAGLHQPTAMRDIFADFEACNKWRRLGWLGPRDQTTASMLDYREVRDANADWLYERCRGAESIAFDTELTARRQPFCAQVSVRPGEGYMVRSDQRIALEAMQQLLYEIHEVLIHNAKFDLVVAERMGLSVDIRRVIDTMVVAYYYRMPQELKALSRRLLGMRMQEWEDIVWPQYEQDCMAWLLEAEGLVATRIESEQKLLEDTARQMAELEIPDDAKFRKREVGKLAKAYAQQVSDEQLDWWRPPLESYTDKNGKAGRRRGVGYDKMIGRIAYDHQRAMENGGNRVKFHKRWFGVEDDDEAPGVIDRLPLWAVKMLRERVGEFPRMGLDQAPYEQALHYACRDVDAEIRLWRLMKPWYVQGKAVV